MRVFSINKTQFKLLYHMYNKNENSKLLTHGTQIDQALKLCEKCPDMFFANRLAHSEYSFHIKALGEILDLIKYNGKFEAHIELTTEEK